MRIIKKKDLELIDGMLVEKATGQIVVLPHLANEVNELTDLAELIAFVKANKPAIEAAAKGHEVIRFTPSQLARPKLEVTGAKPATPLADEAKAAAEALANEFLDVRVYENVNTHLARYKVIADWLSTDYVMDTDAFDSVRFKANPMEMTEKKIIALVTEYNDPAIKKLINSIDLGR